MGREHLHGISAQPAREGAPRGGTTQSYELSPGTRLALKQSAMDRMSSTFVTVISLLFSAGMFWLLVTGGTRPQVTNLAYFIAPGAMLAGLYFLYIRIQQWKYPGYSRVALSERGITFTSYRDGVDTLLRWDEPRFRLLLDKTELINTGKTLYEDNTNSVVCKHLSREAFFGIIEAARSVGLTVNEKVAWGGAVTHFKILPKSSATHAPGHPLSEASASR